MRYTVFGRTGLWVSTIGFGGIPIQRLGFQEAVAVLQRAVDLGMNYIDTAAAYTDSEAKIGAALQGQRQEVILATKTHARTKDEAAAHMAQSLAALQTDYIDVYQLHNVSEMDDLEKRLAPDGAYAALAEAQAAGKIGHIGITSHKPAVACQALWTGKFASVLIPFNLVETEATQELLPLARELGVAFIDMKPFCGGAFSDARLALKYVLSAGVTLTIPGMATVEEVEENAALGDVEPVLTAAEQEKVLRAAAELGKTFCRRCDYCQPCAQEISISSVLFSPFSIKRFGLQLWGLDHWRGLLTQAEACTECGECLSRCPYGLDIPTLIKERVAYLRGELAQVL